MTRFFKIPFFILVSVSLCRAQSLIVGIPSADVAEQHHLEITHESQLNFWEGELKWNSFNFACYGIGHNMELTAALNNLNNDGSSNLAVGIGAKKVLPFPIKYNGIKEIKLTVGSNLLYSINKEELGVWAYGHASARISSTHKANGRWKLRHLPSIWF
jgi:hypothetical protein